jgi:CubicO group peptidase (beta-lactamase class C family)
MQDFDLRHTNYHFEPENSRHPSYPFRMSARDLARFGLLFLNDGKWNSGQIIPSEWVRESTRSYSETSVGGYGYMWWTESGSLGELGTYVALGNLGHAIYVIPAARLVFVHRVDSYQRKRISPKTVRKI